MKDILRHLFIPHESNNYKAKLLHHDTLLAFIVILILGAFALNIIQINFPSVLGVSADMTSQQLLTLLNQERKQNGLASLSLSPQLTSAAQNKANDMIAKDYWAHNSTDGETPWDFIKAAGYNYFYAGENLARGYNTSPDVTNAWMASPDHRANMLSPNYTDVGFAVVTGKLTGEETVLVVEELGSRTLAAAPYQLPNKKIVSASGAKTKEIAVNVQGIKSSSKSFPAAIKKSPLIDSLSLTFRTDTLIIVLFIFVLLLDMIVIERRKIARFVEHNPDHVFYLASVLLIIIILSSGEVL